MAKPSTAHVYVVDDDQLVRNSLSAVLETVGHQVTGYPTGADFLADLPDLPSGCVTLDVRMPGMDGLDVLERLRKRRPEMPVIMISGIADVAMAVRAMRSGAVDFIEKPFELEDVLTTLARVLSSAPSPQTEFNSQIGNRDALVKLTKREIDVLNLLIQGDQNKVVAQKLNISPRTVEVHRGHIMRRMNVKSFAELVRIAVLSGMEFD